MIITAAMGSIIIVNRNSRKLLLGVALATGLGAGLARAGTLIEFPNASGQAAPAHLRGYLARPDAGLSAYLGGQAGSAGPYPAVVVLHGCSGLNSQFAQIADRIGGWGYVALAIDSYGPRDIAEYCGGPGLLDQVTDAYAGLRYLSRLDFVDPARVAVLGYSMGGFSALYAVDRNSAAQRFEQRFRAAIAYYPNCGLSSPMLMAPTLILIGDKDDSTRAEVCQAMVEHIPPQSAPITLIVYPGVYHAFDFAQFDHPVSALGHRYEYDRSAARDAESKLRDFLAAHLRTVAAH